MVSEHQRIFELETCLVLRHRGEYHICLWLCSSSKFLHLGTKFSKALLHIWLAWLEWWRLPYRPWNFLWVASFCNSNRVSTSIQLDTQDHPERLLRLESGHTLVEIQSPLRDNHMSWCIRLPPSPCCFMDRMTQYCVAPSLCQEQEILFLVCSKTYWFILCSRLPHLC